MKSKRRKVFTPQRVIRWLRAKLRQDPTFMDVLKKLIDEVPEEISDDTLFELLKPALSHPWPPSPDSLARISSDSVDLLFHPGVRKKLKEWQQAFFDNSLKASQRAKAGYKIEKVFKRLLFQGSGPRKRLSSAQEDEVFRQRQDIKRICQEIIRGSSLAGGGVGWRRKLIKKKFQWCSNLSDSDNALEKAASTKRAEEMRADVLAIKYNCHPRTIKEIIRRREEGFRELRKLNAKHPHIRSAVIYGSGKNKRIRTP